MTRGGSPRSWNGRGSAGAGCGAAGSVTGLSLRSFTAGAPVRRRARFGRAARCAGRIVRDNGRERSEEHTSELQSLMRISYAVFCLKKKTIHTAQQTLLQFMRSKKKIKQSQNNCI